MKKNKENNFLKDINSGKLKIKPKFQIFLEKIGLGGLFFLSIISLSFVFGFIYYWFIFNTEILTNDFILNFKILFSLAPVFWIFLFLFLFLILLLFLRQYDFSYKKPFLIIISVLVFLVLIFAYGFYKHPPARRFYQKQCNCMERQKKMIDLEKQGIIIEKQKEECPMMKR